MLLKEVQQQAEEIRDLKQDMRRQLEVLNGLERKLDAATRKGSSNGA
jgi:hypothetical protein